MRTLFVIRHAKSSWNEPDLADFDRPLNERGKRDAPRMGKRLKERDVHPNIMLSSPARRALSTCRKIAEVIGYARENIKIEPELYHAGEEEILDIVRQLSPSNHTVVLVGHNPGITDFVNSINASREPFIPRVPTCGVVSFSFDVDDWKSIGFGTGEFVFFDFPKNTTRD